MEYEEFLKAWVQALRESELPIIGLYGHEHLDLRNLDRTYECFVEPIGGQHTAPFHSTAQFRWTWRSLATARTVTSEEDMLSELLGVKRAHAIKTERPSLRVDVTLSGSSPYGKPLPMPPPKVWSSWVDEAVTRLETCQRLLPDETVRHGKDGMLEVLAWGGEPEVEAVCQPDGKLMLSAVKLSSWQAIDVPRRWAGESHRPDKHPAQQLTAFFKRVKASLHAWTETLDHLR